MKTNKFFAILLSALAFVGCQESQEYQEVVYFTGTESSATISAYIDGPTDIPVTITSSCKVTADMNVELEVVGEVLDQYNAENGTEYKMLPEGSYALSTTTVTIPAGSATSTKAALQVLSQDDFEIGVTYCCPIRIKSTSNGTAILKASQIQFIVLKSFTHQYAMNLAGRYHISMESMYENPDCKDFTAATLELHIYVIGWSISGHQISALMGTEENFALRMGDVGIAGVPNPAAVLNLAGRGPTLNCNSSPLSLGRWYHVAAVDDGTTEKVYLDGVEIGSMDSAGRKAIDFSESYGNKYFSIGAQANDYRHFNGYVYEARAWKRALTPTELTNNQCVINPAKAEGLVGYWRCDGFTEIDGKKVVEDLSGHGYHGTPSGDIQLTPEKVSCPNIQ